MNSKLSGHFLWHFRAESLELRVTTLSQTQHKSVLRVSEINFTLKGVPGSKKFENSSSKELFD